MQKFCCALIAWLPPAACAYPLELEKQFNGADVSVTTQAIDHNRGAVLLSNYGRSAAQCAAVCRNGPEAPRTRKVLMAPGQSSNLAMKFARSLIKLRLQLTCGLK